MIDEKTQKNIQTVKDFFAAVGGGDMQKLFTLAAEDIEWTIPGEGWPLAGNYHGHADVPGLLEKASKVLDPLPTPPPEFVAQGDRVLVVGSSKGKIKTTNKAFEDNFIFALTVRDGKVTTIREYFDTQKLARAATNSAE